MCEKCLYRNNCQFLVKHRKSVVDGCTAFKSEAELRAEVAREIFGEIGKRMVCTNDEDFRVFAELKKKYTEEQT